MAKDIRVLDATLTPALQAMVGATASPAATLRNLGANSKLRLYGGTPPADGLTTDRDTRAGDLIATCPTGATSGAAFSVTGSNAQGQMGGSPVHFAQQTNPTIGGNVNWFRLSDSSDVDFIQGTIGPTDADDDDEYDITMQAPDYNLVTAGVLVRINTLYIDLTVIACPEPEA